MPGDAGGGASACSSPPRRPGQREHGRRHIPARLRRRAAAPHRAAAATSDAGARARARGRRDQARRRRLAVPRAAHRCARPRQEQRPRPAGNLPPFPGLRVRRAAPAGSSSSRNRLTPAGSPRGAAGSGGSGMTGPCAAPIAAARSSGLAASSSICGRARQVALPGSRGTYQISQPGNCRSSSRRRSPCPTGPLPHPRSASTPIPRP